MSGGRIYTMDRNLQSFTTFPCVTPGGSIPASNAWPTGDGFYERLVTLDSSHSRVRRWSSRPKSCTRSSHALMTASRGVKCPSVWTRRSNSATRGCGTR